MALSSSLSIGTKYYVSFKVSLCAIDSALGYTYATNKLGISFSTISYNAYTNPAPIVNFAHIYTDSIISDTLNWTTISGSFIADSAYKYIIVGKFFDDAHTNKIKLCNADTAFGYGAYYFVDDICVSTDSIYASTWTEINDIKKSQNDVLVYPNPSSNEIQFEFKDYSPTKIVISDNLGRYVLEKIIPKNSYYVKIDVSDLSPGFYYANLEYVNCTINKKIVIVKP